MAAASPGRWRSTSPVRRGARSPLGKPVMNLTFRWFLKKLRRYTDEKYAVPA